MLWIAELEKKLGEAWKVIIKMHPRLHSGLTNCDIATNRLMPVADVLVTDYSSLVFEYALYKKPWVIFAPDIESYSKGRSFYLDYKTDMPAPLVTEGEKLAQAVLDSEKSFDHEGVERFTEKYMSACDGRSTERIIDSALEKERF